MQKKFERVVVLKGGPSSEREVSLRSGAAIANGLRSIGYSVTEVDMTSRTLDLPTETDAVFIALHGTFGEDGELQQILEERGVPYTGSGVEGSRTAFDKVASKRLFEKHGIPTARYEVLKAGEPRTLSLPVVVKPPREGSSVGVSKVTKEEEWPAALETALALNDEALVEAYIEGRELTVGVVGNQVLPVIEIRAPDGSYSYTAKYTKGMTEYLVPAPLTPEETRLCQEIAWATFEVLGCRGMGRVDIRLTDDGEPFVLEINTIPGFTETSLLPKAARAAGIEFPQLCEMILNLAGLDARV